MIQEQEVIRIGTLRRPHGKKGEVQCQMDNEYWDEADAEFVILKIENIFVPFRVTDWRGKGSDTLIFALQGIDSEEKAARLTGTETFMLRRDLVGQEDTELTWQSLTGYQVEDREQGALGTVTEVDETTMNTLLTLSDGRLIPIHEDFIDEIDTDKHLLRINLPFLLN